MQSFSKHQSTVTTLVHLRSDPEAYFQPLILTGTVPIEQRDDVVRSFQGSNGSRPLLIGRGVGGVGLSIYMAGRV